MTDTEAGGRPGPQAVERIEQTFTTMRTGIRTIGWCFGAYVASQAVIAMAGQTTNVIVSATLSFLADLKFVISIALTGAAVAWAAVERSLRHRKVENLQARIKSLETSIDASRTSSGLTPKGKTNPKDIKL
jgi:hypothetical protein